MRTNNGAGNRFEGPFPPGNGPLAVAPELEPSSHGLSLTSAFNRPPAAVERQLASQLSGGPIYAARRSPTGRRAALLPTRTAPDLSWPRS